jgi:hypothetical protein
LGALILRGTASSDPKDWPSSELAGYAWKESSFWNFVGVAEA